MAKYRLSPEALRDIRFTCPTVNIFPRLRVITAGTSELEPLLMGLLNSGRSNCQVKLEQVKLCEAMQVESAKVPLLREHLIIEWFSRGDAYCINCPTQFVFTR